MNVWLIQVGEPLPTDSGDPRPYRTWLMAQAFRARSHSVDWFAADFNHLAKTHRGLAGQTRMVEESFRIHYLASPGYGGNVSLARLSDHAALPRAFAAMREAAIRPDVIICSYPTIELALSAVRYGKERGVPVFVDVRDLWPESFLDAAPGALRPLAKMLLYPYYRQAGRVFRDADAVIGNTGAMVEWARRLGKTPLRAADRGVYMAYPETEPATERRQEAEEFWDRIGIDRERWGLIACFFGTFNPKYLLLPEVIRAFRRGEVRDKKIVCVLCGDGDDWARCRELAAGAENIFLPGWVDGPRIHALLRRCHLGLAPYRSRGGFRESIPNKPPEYLSAGLPVATCLEGELRRLLERGGCGAFYPEGDEKALAALLLELEADRGRLGEMSRRAGELYRNEFRAETVYGNFAESVENYVEERRQQRGTAKT